MTVSRVINKDQNVRPDTRERVKAAIGALNYAPNAAARALAGAAQTRIALVYGNPSAAYLSELLVGALTEASRSDVQLVLEKCDSLASSDDLARRLVDQRPNGVILPPPFCDSAPLIAALRAADVPTALIASASPELGSFVVSIDDVQAAFDMTTHLLRSGHRRIGFIIGNPNHTASDWRLQGYKRALAEAGVAFEPKLVAQGDFTYRSGLAATERLLRAAPRPTAIFASNDDMAAAAVAAAHIKHLAVPEDLSVCGFDDTALATTIAPELTTIRQPIAEMAHAAVAMLTAKARRRGAQKLAPPQRKVLAYQLIRRTSDAPPPLELRS